jgi:hypothetical protein
LGRFPAAYDEHKLVGAGLEGGIGSYNGLAFGLLLFGQWLDNQEFNACQPFVFLSGNHGANDAGQLHQAFLQLK